MLEHEKYMLKAISLAENGIGYVAPNPLVGCVIVANNQIIGEGFHKEYGGPHAEVNAIRMVKEKELLIDSTLYVNLEPCNHFGKTPPCTGLILSSGIKKVVVCNLDPNPLVSEKGIQRLKESGVEVLLGVCESQGKELNRRFFTFHEKKRPYLVLKWAQTRDGYISRFPVPKDRTENLISGEDAQWMTHVWRSHEQAIMVGSNTVLADDPQLNVRLTKGKDPVKIILDKDLKLGNARLLRSGAKTIVFTENNDAEGYGEDFYGAEVELIRVNFDDHLIKNVLRKIYEKNIISVLVEGGAQLLQSYIDLNLFDEIRVFESEKVFKRGVEAPFIALDPDEIVEVGEDTLKIYRSIH
jgi:diaminohydroxyphosphoribosylaminopyrimidine deaminase/5-amino-6-(5-phosphoribosylamino)uracil reductase